MKEPAPAAKAEIQSGEDFSQLDWVEAAKHRAVMRGLRVMQWPMLGLLGVQVGLLYRHVASWELLLWLLGSLAVWVWRQLACERFDRLRLRGNNETLAEQLGFARRMWPLWLTSAAVWAVMPLWFYHRLPFEAGLTGWSLVLLAGIVSMLYTASRMGACRLYWWVLAVGVALGMLPLLWKPLPADTGVSGWWLVASMGFYLLMLRLLAYKVHDLYEQGVDLRYHNMRLIQSLRQQTHAAQEAAQFRSRFLLGAAHDLKQPIHALGIYAEWLSNEPDLVDELGPKILQSTQAINTLFDSLLELAKLDSNVLQVEPRVISVVDLLADLHVQFRPLALQKGLQLRLRTCGAQIWADPLVMRRILGNLIANAIRYTSHGGVLLAARRRAGQVAFEVWDTGIGLAPEHSTQIFTEFYKVQKGGTEEGFGLGLAIVQRLTQAMEYPVTLRSRVARGSMFRVLVPLADSASAAQQAVRAGKVQGLGAALDAQATEEAP